MNEVSQKIVQEIAAKGLIPFARFMELSLYCPVYGYYEREQDTIGARGDYYTSVSVGPLLGELLAFQWAEWLEAWTNLPGAGKPILVEAGAHDGRLAGDILTWLQAHRSELFERLEYWIIEPSTRRRDWQHQHLHRFDRRVRWGSKLEQLPRTSPGSGFQGILFSNEFLDALPVHRLGWDAAAGHWFEWGVTWVGDRFAWIKMHHLSPGWVTTAGNPEDSSSSIQIANFAGMEFPPELLAVLPDGYTIELCPVAVRWWRQAAELLDRGVLVTLDYGSTAEELFQPEKSSGTLRAFRAHRLVEDLLANPGEQDLTAQVNFTAIQAAGAAAGLKSDRFTSQEQFLVQVLRSLAEQPGPSATWTARQARQFQTLTHPDHLGRAFRVLVQSRSNHRGL